MRNIHTYNKNNDISEKGQKVVAALYLVTNHLSDTEPFKIGVRTKALLLLDSHADRSVVSGELTNLLKSAAIAKIISEHNTSILVRELTHFVQSVGDTTSLAPLFADSPIYPSRTSVMSYKSPSLGDGERPVQNNPLKNENKNKRQEQIVSFINGRKSAVIKDIVTLFPEVSEKTIQRELGTLVDSGKITKRGSKRWSIYMAI